ncbi:MAG: response regulator [Bryobacteraceae bacterium]|nr:response regulator [Bryobacteraceae bacterium]
MSRTAKAYITFAISLGALALWHGLFPWDPRDLPRFLCYLALALPASCLKMRLPGVTGTMSVLFLFLLASIVELGLPETLVIAATCSLVQNFWHAKAKPRAVQVLFGVANLSTAVTAAHWVYHSQADVVAYLGAPFQLIAAASVFFVTNTVPVAAAIAVTEGKSLRQVWAHFYCWSFPYYLVGAAIVGVFSSANRMLDWRAWLLILPVVYVIYRSYHLYLRQLDNERKRADEQRQHAEEVASLHAKSVEALKYAMSANAKLDTVIQASPLAILALDRDGNVTSWNGMAERMFGWSREEALGRPLPLGGVKPEKVIHELIERTLRGELLSDVEATEWRRDGSSFEAAIWSAPIADRSEVSGVLIMIADVSDRKRLEEQLRLSYKMEAVGRLAGGIAHDFNNLLTVINGYSSLLLESVKDDPEAASEAGEILSAGNRAADLVSKLLSFSRRQVIKPKPLDVNHLVRNIERMLARLIGEHIELRTALNAEPVWIVADPNQIEAALMNLATNARDAMPNGGVLSIETACVDAVADRDARRAHVPLGAYVRLLVRDTGYGMDVETQQHIFEPFFTTKQTGKGTGLGLSSVYGAVEQNQGFISVESEIGSGTTFSIYLPRFERTQPSESQRVGPDDLPRGSETILLVEDEVPVRRMLRDTLSNSGYRVWEAGNGAEAMSRWAAQIDSIDLLVTDVVMPLMSGLKLAEELRKRRANLKVLLMSGHADEMITSQGTMDPAFELLSKPFLPRVLARKVREILDQAPQRVEPRELRRAS